jgi:GNAT superfamily N-acetyltransferase
MAVYHIDRYPRDVELRDGTRLALRPMERKDCTALLAFFQQIPEAERFFLQDDVTAPAVIERWARELDYDRALPLLALDGEHIVADAVLLRRRGGARSHLAELRLVVDPAYRRRGLGSKLMHDLAEIAYDAELDQLIFELVKDVEDEAIDAVTFFGAVPLATIPDLVKDPSGRPHDVVYLSLPLGRYWKWAEF